MLGFMFDEENPPQSKEWQQANESMTRFATRLKDELEAHATPDNQLLKYYIWTKGLQSSLQELQASYYAASKFRMKIIAKAVKDMGEQERMDYSRYVYFDKNGFIRVFSLLDKLGTFTNDFLHLHTEKIKPHFSFFTVLRTMREKKVHLPLMQPLNELKEATKQETHRLRNRRNIEIHYMNSEMQDDLLQQTRMYGQEVELEDLDQQMHDLSVGLHLAILSLQLTFDYVNGLPLRS